MSSGIGDRQLKRESKRQIRLRLTNKTKHLQSAEGMSCIFYRTQPQILQTKLSYQKSEIFSQLGPAVGFRI